MYNLRQLRPHSSALINKNEINNIINMTSTKEVLSKAALNFLIGSIGSYYLLGESGNINLFNMNIPAPIIVGASTASGSLLNDAAKDYVIQKLPQSQDYKNAESTAVGIGLSGGGTVAGLKVLGGLPNSEAPRAFAIGAGTKIASDWAYNNIVSKNKMGFLI